MLLTYEQFIQNKPSMVVTDIATVTIKWGDNWKSFPHRELNYMTVSPRDLNVMAQTFTFHTWEDMYQYLKSYKWVYLQTPGDLQYASN